VIVLIRRFCPGCGAFLNCIKEEAILFDSYGLEVGDALTSISGNFVHGHPKAEAERAWTEVHDDENNDFLDLVLPGALAK